MALGLLSPRGERAVLTVPVDVLMRVTSNPFFPYLAESVSEWVGLGQGRPAKSGFEDSGQ